MRKRRVYLVGWEATLGALLVPLGGPLLWACLGNGGAEVLAWDSVLTLLLTHGNAAEKVLENLFVV